jgi:bifunctional non-homologous end joining protein LigD
VNFNPKVLAQNAEACESKRIPTGPDNVAEPKYDGFRLLVHVGENGVETFTRTGNSQRGKLPLIEAELAKLKPGTWLDGELISINEEGLVEWGAVQSVMGSTTEGAARKSGNLVYVAFDVLAFDGLDIRALPLSDRRSALERILTPSARVRLTPQMESSEASYNELLAQGFEGAIIKRLSAPYASGKRGKGWQKVKPVDEMDCVIMGFKPGENGFSGMIGAIEFGQYQNGTLTYRGRCSGMDMKVRKAMSADEQSYIGKVISLAYGEIMPSGAPRFPRFMRLRDDKLAQDCEWTV